MFSLVSLRERALRDKTKQRLQRKPVSVASTQFIRLKMFRQQWQRITKYLCLCLFYINWSVFLLAIERQFCLNWKLILFPFYKIEKNSYSKPTCPKHYSSLFLMHCFFPFFWLTFISMFRTINFYFSFQLTFSLLFNPLFPLFTFVRYEYRAQCFVFSLFGRFVSILRISRSFLWMNFAFESCKMPFLFSVLFPGYTYLAVSYLYLFLKLESLTLVFFFLNLDRLSR